MMYGLGDEIAELNAEIRRLKARKTRLLSENRKLRERVKELGEQLAAARQQLDNFKENSFSECVDYLEGTVMPIGGIGGRKNEF